VLSAALRARLAIGAVFLVNGTLFATWVSRIPAVKERLALSQSSLGLALLGIGVGTVAGLPATSWLIGRLGSRRITGAGALCSCLSLALVAHAPTFAALVAGLFFFGAFMGALDVAVNGQAATLERRLGRSLMSTFHGLWSVGGLVGSALGGALTRLGLGPAAHFALLAAALLALAAVAYGGLVEADPAPPEERGPWAGLAWPSAEVVGIGTIAAFAAIVEGGIADWSGLYLRQSLGSPADVAPAGFAAFSVTMTVARFGGDHLVDKVGRRALLRSGPLLTAAALAVALLVASPAVAIVAFGVAGLGMAAVFPVAFGQAGAREHPGQSIAAVATMAYGAGLLGPPAIGFLADLTSLPRALGALVVACLAIVLLAR